MKILGSKGKRKSSYLSVAMQKCKGVWERCKLYYVKFKEQDVQKELFSSWKEFFEEEKRLVLVRG